MGLGSHGSITRGSHVKLCGQWKTAVGKTTQRKTQFEEVREICVRSHVKSQGSATTASVRRALRSVHDFVHCQPCVCAHKCQPCVCAHKSQSCVCAHKSQPRVCAQRANPAYVHARANPVYVHTRANHVCMHTSVT